MSISRDLFRLFSDLKKDNPGFSVFSPDGMQKIETSPVAKLVSQRMSSNKTELIAEVMGALEVQDSMLTRKMFEGEFVVTLPRGNIQGVRTISGVVREMIKEARNEIVTVGYEINNSEFIELIQLAIGRGCKVYFLCDRGRGTATKLKEIFSGHGGNVKIFQDKETNAGEGYPFSKMHSKTLLIDSKDLLISSANFTHHGFSGNIEFGIRMSGGRVADAKTVISRIITNRELIDQIQ